MRRADVMTRDVLFDGEWRLIFEIYARFECGIPNIDRIGQKSNSGVGFSAIVYNSALLSNSRHPRLQDRGLTTWYFIISVGITKLRNGLSNCPFLCHLISTPSRRRGSIPCRSLEYAYNQLWLVRLHIDLMPKINRGNNLDQRPFHSVRCFDHGWFNSWTFRSFIWGNIRFVNDCNSNEPRSGRGREWFDCFWRFKHCDHWDYLASLKLPHPLQRVWKLLAVRSILEWLGSLVMTLTQWYKMDLKCYGLRPMPCIHFGTIWGSWYRLERYRSGTIDGVGEVTRDHWGRLNVGYVLMMMTMMTTMIEMVHNLASWSNWSRLVSYRFGLVPAVWQVWRGQWYAYHRIRQDQCPRWHRFHEIVASIRPNQFVQWWL